MNNKQKAKNAIKWIENLPNYKQAPSKDRECLGSSKYGYCCLGAGCEILEIDFETSDNFSTSFTYAVGLKTKQGSLKLAKKPAVFYGKTSLASVNDYTNAGFKRIASLMKRHPDLMFDNEVAPLIAKHFA